VVERVAVLELDPSCPCHVGCSFRFPARGQSPQPRNHYRKYFRFECYANVTRMLRFRNIRFSVFGAQKRISPLWHRGQTHFALRNFRKAIFVRVCKRPERSLSTHAGTVPDIAVNDSPCRLQRRHLVFKIPLCKCLEFFVEESALLRPFREKSAKPPRLARAAAP